jgi:regulator of sigma E protease
MQALQLIWQLSQTLFFIATGIVGVGFLIAFHELGHFFFCKLFDVKTPAFSIGFGPQLLKKQIGETEFSIAAIPLGGYVQMESGSSETGISTDPRSFNAKPYWQKLLVMCGGIGFNLIFAYLVLTILAFTGVPKTLLLYPKNATATVDIILPNSAAELAGLQKGDIIRTINNEQIDGDVTKLLDTIKPLANQKVRIGIERQNSPQEVLATLGEKEIGTESVGSLGVIFELQATPGLSIVDAIKQGIALTNKIIANTIDGFASIVRQKDMSQVGGPLMIISMTTSVAAQGLKILLLFLAVISVNLAILNIIPLPIFDGGQILFYTIEAIIRRPLPERVREYIHIGSWLCLMVLVIYLTGKDIARIAAPQIGAILRFFGLEQ